MKLTIIAATGGVGCQLLAQALDEGHDVTAGGGATPAKLLAGRAARIVTADLAAPDAQVLESAVAGADGVVLSGRSARTTTLRTPGSPRLSAPPPSSLRCGPPGCCGSSRSAPPRSPPRPLPAARTRPCHDPGDGFIMRQAGVRIAKTLFGKVYDDLARMEDLLRESGLDWDRARGPRSSPASRSPAATAPPWGATYAAAGPSPAPTSPTTCSPSSASRTPPGRSSASPPSQDRHRQR